MPTTDTAPAPDFGQVWMLGDQLALVFYVNTLRGIPTAHLTEIVDGRAAGNVFVADVVDGRIVTKRGTWSLTQVLPRLRCIDATAARKARKFLTDQGLSDVVVSGNYVAAPLTVTSVMQLAEDALANGWADDAECAAMIGRLG